ncbi:MAG: transketolase [Spirochaetes bacterium]|nr:transketolase [Spirochaetota bacterium]
MDITVEDLKIIANTIRTLSMDAVEKAKSGHPGMPMGCADIAAVLFAKILRHYPSDPAWINRDRFVLSAGHGSMLLYSVLHLSGYDVTLDDLKNFRQLGSKTPGHPEFGHTPGVETTTGPLGQGFANAVGMAFASNILAAEFNDENAALVDHYIYAIVSDGDLMEGVTSEAASLAGHLGLGNIIFIYDSNDISIEGCTDLAQSDDVESKFVAHNWHVQTIDGHDFNQIEKSILAAQDAKERPSLIIAKTKIAKGSPRKEGCEEAHGAPLGADEVRETKLCLGCSDEHFHVPARVYEAFRERMAELAVAYTKWNGKFNRTIKDGKKKKWDRFFSDPDVSLLRKSLPAFDENKPVSTRAASGKVLEALFNHLPNLAGGSADLAPSNKSFVKGFSETGKNRIGRNVHFGVREHSMGAIQNGMAYYGGFIPYSATFFAFMDYMRPPIRMAALSGLRCIYLFTHDSIFVGEDGPTHQPVEHLAAARVIPNLTVIRPADAEETKEAWLAAIANSGPTALILTRQDLPVAVRSAEGLHRGAYVIRDSDRPGILLMASGSEVHITLQAAVELENRGIRSRVVSFPSWELFDAQDENYRRSVLPDSIAKRAVVEAGIPTGWEKYAGPGALYIAMNSFGASAPADVLAARFGFTADSIVTRVIEYLK